MSRVRLWMGAFLVFAVPLVLGLGVMPGDVQTPTPDEAPSIHGLAQAPTHSPHHACLMGAQAGPVDQGCGETEIRLDSHTFIPATLPRYPLALLSTILLHVRSPLPSQSYRTLTFGLPSPRAPPFLVS